MLKSKWILLPVLLLLLSGAWLIYDANQTRLGKHRMAEYARRLQAHEQIVPPKYRGLRLSAYCDDAIYVKLENRTGIPLTVLDARHPLTVRLKYFDRYGEELMLKYKVAIAWPKSTESILVELNPSESLGLSLSLSQLSYELEDFWRVKYVVVSYSATSAAQEEMGKQGVTGPIIQLWSDVVAIGD